MAKLISPTIFSLCPDNISDIFISYPSGATDFSLSYNESPGFGIALTESGAITFGDTFLLIPGQYHFVVRYKIEEAEFSESILMIVHDCYALNKNDFSVCVDTVLPSFQLAVQGYTATAFSKTSGNSGITVNSTGAVTINTSVVGVGNYTINVQYSISALTIVKPINIHVVACTETTTVDYAFCEKDTMNIVWMNELGGWENYHFIQTKIYSVKQSGSKSFVNFRNEERFSDRGKVENWVECTNQMIPKSHVDKIKGLRDSIQVYLMDNMQSVSDAIPIKIEEGNYTLYETNQEYYSLSFKFKYAVDKRIQSQ